MSTLTSRWRSLWCYLSACFRKQAISSVEVEGTSYFTTLPHTLTRDKTIMDDNIIRATLAYAFLTRRAYSSSPRALCQLREGALLKFQIDLNYKEAINFRLQS
jgi:hypothetical protein